MVRQKEIFKGRNKNLGINLCFILFTSGTRKTWWHFSNGESGIIEYLSIEKVRYHIWRFAEKRMTKYSFGSTPYVTELCVGPRYMGNIYHLKILNLLFLFHLKIQNANTSGLQALLNRGFGDYMQLPPEEDRQPHHEALIVDTKKSYTEYLKINKR